MTEPYQIRQAFGAPFLPPKAPPPATPYASYPEAYLAGLLAKEAVAVRKRHAKERHISPMARPQTCGAAREKPTEEERRIGDENRSRVLDAINGPTTVQSIAIALGLGRPTVTNHLCRMRAQGKVTMFKVKKVGYWLRIDNLPAQEAAE